MTKQRKEEDFWDKHKDFRSKSNSDESDFVESSFDGYRSVEENLDEKENGGGNSTQKELGVNDESVQLEVKEHVIQPVWNDDLGEYLQGIRRCDSSPKEKYEQCCKKEIEKSVSTTKSIVDIFSAQFNKNQSQDERVLSSSLPAIFSPKNTGKK